MLCLIIDEVVSDRNEIVEARMKKRDFGREKKLVGYTFLNKLLMYFAC
jgi:hypothetical protein